MIMGMTIEEAIEEGGPCTETTWESEWVDLALDTMKKYQKIVEILNSASYIEDGREYSYIYDEYARVKHIREVVEDGSENNYHASNS